MTIEHKDIPEAGLHEPKGASLATSGQVYVADGAGSGEWTNALANAANIKIERLLDGLSVASSQLPTGLDAPMQIEFGPAVNTISDPVMLDATGMVTINETGTYRIKLSLIYGRTGSTGTSKLYLRVLVNGNQAGQSIQTRITSSDIMVPFSDEAWIYLEAGTTLTYEVLRDSTGNDSGGLYMGDPVLAGWNNSPSAAIRIERWSNP
jgi:hypothetical protein